MIYLIVFTLSIWVLSKMSIHNSKYTKTRYWWCSVISMLFLVLLAGFRDKGVGIDTNVYIDTYSNIAQGLGNFSEIISFNQSGVNVDKAFLALAFLSHKLSNGTFLFFTFIELAILFPLFLGAYNLTKKDGNVSIVITFFFLLVFLKYTYSYNVMRQFCAVSWSFLAFTYYLNKRWILFLIFFLIAYLFHSSAILFIPFLFLEYVSRMKNKTLQKIMLYLIPIFLVFVFYKYDQILQTLSYFSNDVYATRYSTDSMKYAGRDRISYTDLVFVLYCFGVIIYSFRYKLLSVKENIYVLLLNICVLFCISLSLLSEYMNRTVLFPLIIELWYLAKILCAMKNKPIKYGFYVLAVSYWFYTYIIRNTCETYPYTSTILGI